MKDQLSRMHTAPQKTEGPQLKEEAVLGPVEAWKEAGSRLPSSRTATCDATRVQRAGVCRQIKNRGLV